MEIKNKEIILRDFIKSDVDDLIYWDVLETEWKLFDGPWEIEGEFNLTDFREKALATLYRYKNDEIRERLEICIDNKNSTHIGWCSFYYVDNNYNFTEKKDRISVSIDIPVMKERRKGYGKLALITFIDYLKSKGENEIYLQTWSGNFRMIKLAEKIGFVEIFRKIDFRIVRGEYYDEVIFKLDNELFDKLKK